MIQTKTFEHAKQIARLGLGNNWRTSFLYWSDIKRQWEDSHDSTKAARVIGGLSAPAHALDDIRALVGDLSEAESDLSRNMTEFYSDVANLLTSVEVLATPEIDILETILDLRFIREHVTLPCRVLDIGPGSGRDMAGLFLSDLGRDCSYTGVDSVCIPYQVQNLGAKLLRSRLADLSFHDLLDYQFSRQDFPIEALLAANSICHLPLWEAGLLQDQSYDLIICNYVLDELPPDDFHRVMAHIDRCLAADGLVYCRGSQHRAQIANLYLYGYGTYHGHDITNVFYQIGLESRIAQLRNGIFERVFARTTSGFAGIESKYRSFTEDIPLMRELQKDFTQHELDHLIQRKAKVIVWGDAGYADYERHIAPYWDGLDIVAMTNRFVEQEGVTPFGFREVPLSALADIDVDCVLIASNRFVSYLRQLGEITGGERYQLVRQFSLPVAFAYRREAA